MAKRMPETMARSFGDDAIFTELFGKTPKVKILASLVNDDQRDLSIQEIAEMAGLHRTTTSDHLDDLEQLNVVVQTRKIGRNQMYQINQESPISKDLKQLEIDLVQASEGQA